jgi:DNA-binding MarR family transcriptional regulator
VSESSRILTELDFLAALERGEVVTQMTLSKRMSVSIGLINALLRRTIHKGFVKAKAAPYKRYAYYLTRNGFSEKSRLVARYLEISLNFFRTVRQEYVRLFEHARAHGMRRIAFAGGGELVEIALLAAREADIHVEIIFHQATSKERLYGLSVVRTPEALSSVDAVAITDTFMPQVTFDLVRRHFEEPQVLAPPLLRITRTPLDFKPKVVLK